MNLTAQELRYVERIRKHQRTWRWGRWILLLTSASCLAVTVWMLLFAYRAGSSNPPDVMLFAIAFTKANLYVVAAVIALGLAVRDWHGNMNHLLLLKLIDHCSAQTAPPSEPPTTPVQSTPTRADGAAGRD